MKNLKQKNVDSQYDVFVSDSASHLNMLKYGDHLDFEYKYLKNCTTGNYTVDSKFAAGADVSDSFLSW